VLRLVCCGMCVYCCAVLVCHTHSRSYAHTRTRPHPHAPQVVLETKGERAMSACLAAIECHRNLSTARLLLVQVPLVHVHILCTLVCGCMCMYTCMYSSLYLSILACGSMCMYAYMYMYTITRARVRAHGCICMQTHTS
jgi:hypothetical protein